MLEVKITIYNILKELQNSLWSKYIKQVKVSVTYISLKHVLVLMVYEKQDGW